MTSDQVPCFDQRRTGIVFVHAAVGLLLLSLCPLLRAEVAAKSFDLPADVAENSLKQFATQSGTEVVFATSTVGKVRTNAVKGDYNPRDALNRMVANTLLTVMEDAKTGALVISCAAAPKESERPSSPSTKADERPQKKKNL